MKKFVIYWDKAYAEEKVSLVDETFFRASNGFEREEKSAVENLDVGECTPMDNNHVWVMRVE